MNRAHVLNPTVTVIMHTVGIHQGAIGAAIASFCRQEYRRAVLLVFNTHPSPLRIMNAPQDASIIIVNTKDVFTRPVMQYAAAMKLVRTKAWTILDDDDWIEPDHLGLLVEQWNQATDRTASPLQVCGQNSIAHYDDKNVLKTCVGWCTSLFERLSPDEVDLCYRRFPSDHIIGADRWISGNSYYDRRLFSGKPTYHWDRRGSAHVSNHESRQAHTPENKFWYAMNYWRIKIAAHASELEPVFLPNDRVAGE